MMCEIVRLKKDWRQWEYAEIIYENTLYNPLNYDKCCFHSFPNAMRYIIVFEVLSHLWVLFCNVIVDW